jgi:hypothetical protein
MRAGTITTTSHSVFFAASLTFGSSSRNRQFASPTHSGGFTRSNRVKEK